MKKVNHPLGLDKGNEIVYAFVFPRVMEIPKIILIIHSSCFISLADN
jgi:hypothetical protein